MKPENINLLCVVGARPNFMKIAPIMAALASTKLNVRLVHTGQHYDVAMNERFFEQLAIPAPDINLEVGSGSHAQQTAEIMRRFETILDEENGHAVLVVGDVNSTIACALVAAKKNIKVIHVEAGLRSYDRRMPEEVNRILTDQLSDLLFTTERQALDNLAREGIDSDRVVFVGNVMIDSLLSAVSRSENPELWMEREHGAALPESFGLITLHRPSNVDDAELLTQLVYLLIDLSKQLPLLFPVHPRTRAALECYGLLDRLSSTTGIQVLPPLGYLEMVSLMSRSRLVLTDSGGVQEETTALGIPCLTLRENTERPITVSEGTNHVVGTDVASIREAFLSILEHGGKAGRIPELWDGHAAERIAQFLLEWLPAHVAPAS